MSYVKRNCFTLVGYRVIRSFLVRPPLGRTVHEIVINIHLKLFLIRILILKLKAKEDLFRRSQSYWISEKLYSKTILYSFKNGDIITLKTSPFLLDEEKTNRF